MPKREGKHSKNNKNRQKLTTQKKRERPVCNIF